MKKTIIVILLSLILILATIAFAFSMKGDTTSEPQTSENPSSGSTASKDDSSTPTTSEPTNSDASNNESKSEGSEPEVSQSGDNKVIKFVAVGDSVMHTSILNDASEKATDGETYNFDPIYEDMIDYIKSKDIAYVNVETLIGGPSQPIGGYPNFNSPEEIGNYLVDMGFNVMNLAHNHMLDSYDTTFLKYCNNFFKEKGVTPIGYYKNEEDTNNIIVVEEQGVRIAFLTYTYGTNGITKPASDPTYIPLINDTLIKMQVALAKQQADLVFVSMHWGEEDSWNGTNNVYPPNAEQKRVAQLLVDEGVDVIIGMHPHVIQECKWVERPDGGKTFLVYSLGNFISGMYWGRNMLGAMLELDIVVENGVVSIENPMMIPIVDHYIRRTGEVFRDFKIYFFQDYTEELAAAHGCHTKDDPLISTAYGRKIFSVSSMLEKIYGTFSKEFLPAYLQ
ncbi:MAG: hypothetical protein A2Y17_02380 [Clostridiales bacterium GWF2_38_85]|nr:MAG: hypothetical protein A2Y17_02380 [Clostridiales bacterium GWF2_38_85]HBL85044.1 hypothetical protein [Clostridiales bacterium]